MATTSAQSKSSRSTSCVGVRSVEPELVAGPAAVAGASVADEIDDVRGERGARDLGRAPDRAPQPGQHGQRDAPAEARGLPRGRGAAADDVARSVEALLDRDDHRERGVVGMQDARTADRRARSPERPGGGAAGPTGSARAIREPARSAARRRAHRSAARRPWPRPRPRATSARTAWSGRAPRLRREPRPARSAVRRPRARCAARRIRARRCSRPRSSVADVHESVRSRADAGVIRDAGSYTPKCATTCGAYSSTNAASRSPSRGSMRRNCGAAQAPAGRNEVDADDLGRPLARFDQLRDAGTELTAHSRDEHSGGHDFSASGRRCGKRITSRIEVTPASNMTRRSTPRPMPPVGGKPYSSART